LFRGTALLQKRFGHCFDDLGEEAVKTIYGNKVNVMKEILQNQYERFGNTTIHLTTNLNGKDIEEQYGSRVKSRMREMFNWIELKGNDRRK
jgi:hypothetical protein